MDEYAIKLFESDWKQQLNEENRVPKKPIKNNKIEKFLKRPIMRIIPYPPIFNKIAAKIIDPIVGASTWAFGSHKCNKKNGSFTRKGANKKIIYFVNTIKSVMYSTLNIKFIKNINNTKSGREQKKS